MTPNRFYPRIGDTSITSQQITCNHGNLTGTLTAVWDWMCGANVDDGEKGVIEMIG